MNLLLFDAFSVVCFNLTGPKEPKQDLTSEPPLSLFFFQVTS